MLGEAGGELRLHESLTSFVDVMKSKTHRNAEEY